MTYKKHFWLILGLTFLMLVILAIPIFVIDPFFHYHKPLDRTSYVLDSQRYQNDGILKHFDYDAIITGTSMTENFKTSEFDSIFNVNSIKVPYSGASYYEIDQEIARGFAANPNIKVVIRGLDSYRIKEDKNLLVHHDYPFFLYDNNIFNDVSYFWNKSIIFNDIPVIAKKMYLGEGEPIDFNAYSNWMSLYVFSKESALENYVRLPQKAQTQEPLTDADKMVIKGNIEQNVINLAKNNPQATFYYFFTPYSIAYYDGEVRAGTFEQFVEATRYATQLILQQENIKLFSFMNRYDILCNLNNFEDIIHYHEDVNSRMLQWMKNEDGMLTKDNFNAHFDEVKKFYLEYDYDAIFE